MYLWIIFFSCTNMHLTIISKQQAWKKINKTSDPLCLCLLKIIEVFLFVWQYVKDVAVSSNIHLFHLRRLKIIWICLCRCFITSTFLFTLETLCFFYSLISKKSSYNRRLLHIGINIIGINSKELFLIHCIKEKMKGWNFFFASLLTPLKL